MRGFKESVDNHIEDYPYNNPARLLDCPYCDGTYYPEDEICSFCKRKIE